MRHARRVAPRARAFRVEPGWIVGAILVAAFFHASIATGSTAGTTLPAARAIEPGVAEFSPAWSSGAIANVADTAVAGADAAEAFAADIRTAASAPIVLAPVAGAASSRAGALTAPRPTAASKPTASPRPRATPRPAAAPVKRPVVRPAAAPTPRPAPKPKPPPAIVYRYRAAGRATWGYFGGAVITRLPVGTRIRVCGSRGCWEGVSTGHGPSTSGGNLVDLDTAVFQRICGPLGQGVGVIVLSWR